ncbi:hypothetical protein H6F67_09080 [Microcoleus sp. FACHB-1515]|nr:hypothetical protein [Microcoleus sp. FACHB-1515]
MVLEHGLGREQRQLNGQAQATDRLSHGHWKARSVVDRAAQLSENRFA